MKYSYIIFISCVKYKIESKETIPGLYYLMSGSDFFFLIYEKNSAAALIPSAFLFLYLSLSFSISIQFLLSCSNRVLPRLLKFFHSVILDDDRNKFH